jgi:short-subunit dehydrogenase
MSNKPVVIITGASSGIGEAATRQFVQAGYCAVLAARRVERLQAIADAMSRGGGEALVVPTDIRQFEDIENLVKAALDRFGRIDVLFNNAGIGRLKWLEDLAVDDIEDLIRVNLMGMIYTTRAVLPHMIERRSGSIINMVSIAGLIGSPTYSIYAASKFAVRGFTEALRREVGVYGIHVSGIYPGAVRTEFTAHTQVKRKTGIKTPTALQLSSDSVARAVLGLVKRPRRMLVLPWYMRLAVWINSLFTWLVDWIVEKRFVARERDLSG